MKIISLFELLKNKAKVKVDDDLRKFKGIANNK